MKELKRANRDNNMGTLHLVAALFVMYGHHCALLGQVNVAIFRNGIHSIGVKAIFVISGYLITKSLWNIKGSRIKIAGIYLVKRLGRIYPELLGCLLFSALIVGPLFSNLTFAEYWYNKEVFINYIVYNLAMFPNYGLAGVFSSNVSNTVNGSLWTMPVEISLYILILIIFLLSKNDSVKKIIYGIVTLFIIILFCIRFIFFTDGSCVVWGTDWILAMNIIPYFFVGGAAYVFDVDRYLNLQVSALLLLTFAGGVALNSTFVYEILCLGILSYFVLSLMLAKEQKLKLGWIRGEYAYGIYLYGYVIQQCVISIVFVNRKVTFANFHMTYILSVIVTYIMAMISYNIFYMPTNKLIQRCLAKMK